MCAHGPRFLRLLVTWTFLIDTTHTVALCWLLWSYIVDNFTDPAYLTSAPWPFTTTPLFLAVYVSVPDLTLICLLKRIVLSTAAPIQVYFADRVRTLSKSRVLYGIILLLSLANTTMALVATVFAFTHASYVAGMLPIFHRSDLIISPYCSASKISTLFCPLSTPGLLRHSYAMG